MCGERNLFSYDVDTLLKPISNFEASLHMTKATQNCLKKTIKDPESFKFKNATVGRCKRVQFHTLPELHSKSDNTLIMSELDEKKVFFSKSVIKSEGHNTVQDIPKIAGQITGKSNYGYTV